MKRVIVMALALAGCKTVPAVEVRTVTVDRPVAVACIDKADVPQMPAKVGDQLTGDAAHDAAILAASNLVLRSTLGNALALIGGCVRGG